MAKLNCPNCGGSFSGLICDYCGALTGTTLTVAEQRQALEELHFLIAKSPRGRQVALIKNGYLPDDTAPLIDAGLKCMSLLDEDEINSDRSDSAARRLEAIWPSLTSGPGMPKPRRPCLSSGNGWNGTPSKEPGHRPGFCPDRGRPPWPRSPDLVDLPAVIH